MKFSYSTSLAPAWSLSDVAARAKEIGFDGVEVFLPNATQGDPADGTPLVERELVKLAFEQAEVQLAGLSVSLHWTGDAEHDAKTADAMKRVIELAHRVRAGHVRTLDRPVAPGVNREVAMMRLADALAPLADFAASGGAALLVQNALGFRTSPRMWQLLEQANHPALAAAWDPLATALAGEKPIQAVPVLNSRIEAVVLRDATLADGVLTAFVPPGEGSLDLRRVLDRLRGIGFAGWVSVDYPEQTLPCPADELLRKAIAFLRPPVAATKTLGSKKVA